MEITESCLDAETLAAWVDGGLTPPELERAQTHVAGCVRCQAMVGTLARITAAAAAPTAESARRHLPGWPAWLVPLTAAAAAVTIWIAIPGSQLDTRVPIPPASPVYAPEPKANLPAPPPAPRQEAQASAPATLAAQSPAPERATPERAKEEARADAAVPPSAVLDKIAPQAETATMTGAAPSAAPSDMPPAAPAASAPGPSAGAGSGIATGAGRGGGGGTARAESGVVGGIPPGSAGVGLAFRQALASASRDILSPDPMIRWRLAGSDVEISTNGGATWEVTRTGLNTPLTAGAAPSPTVVWVVGASGVVLVSTNGRTWRRVQFPEITNLSAIRARDARSVAVTTADGRIFSTTDSGATWTQGPQGF